MKTKSLKADIAKKDAGELEEFIRTEREAVRGARFQAAGTGSSAQMRVQRKNIARALTALKSKSA